jgi:hypothetical protein
MLVCPIGSSLLAAAVVLGTAQVVVVQVVVLLLEKAQVTLVRVALQETALVLEQLKLTEMLWVLVGLAAEQMRVAAVLAISVATGLVRIHSNGVTGRLAIQEAVVVQAGLNRQPVSSPTHEGLNRGMELLLFMLHSRAHSMRLATSRFTVIRPTTF